jgi:hypothetical protein
MPRLSALALLICGTASFASVTVASPNNDAKLVSPFLLYATASPCSSQSISAMGYSFDTSSNTTTVDATTINAQVSTTLLGPHVLHVKSWGNLGASCVTDVALNVVVPPTASVPSTGAVSKSIQTLGTWQAITDTSTGSGTSTGTMSLASSPSLSGAAREFVTDYTNSAGERYWVVFGTDASPQNFLYDGWVYLASPSSNIANLEFDLNQVIWNGNTVIYGFQCDGYTNTWDYTTNAGSPLNYDDQWLHSTAYCNPREWITNIWHHVQITYSRDREGNVTYQSVWLDGVEKGINETVPSAFALKWGPALLTNFQVDGLGGYGSATTYLDNLTVYRW